MNVFQWADFFQKLPAAVTSGNGPDVAGMHIDDIPTQAAAAGHRADRRDGPGAQASTSRDFAPAVWQGGLYQNKRYGIPIDVHPRACSTTRTCSRRPAWTRRSPPTNKDEYMAALDKLKGKGVQGSWVSPFQFTGAFMFQSLLWQFGGDLFNAGRHQGDLGLRRRHRRP